MDGGPYRSAGAPSELPCPRCGGGSLWRRTIGSVSVAECQVCEGVWVARETLDMILDDLGLYQEVRTIYTAPHARGEPGGPFYLKCPSCTEVMNKRLFAPTAKVIVDVCRAHGTWFDAGELPAVIDFVERGGLDAAKHAEEERKLAARTEAVKIMARAPQHAGSRIGAAFLWLMRWR
jgi:Zn-finger nucleic acid-binding protein